MINTKKETIPSKIKCVLSFKQFKSQQNIPTKIEFTEHNMKITFTHIANDSLSFVNDLLHPIYKTSKHMYAINYSLMRKTGTNSSFNAIAIEIANPVMNTSVTIALTRLETQSVLFKKKFSEQAVKAMVGYLRRKTSLETKYLMEKYISLLNMLKECLEPQKRENQIIETILVNSYFFGKRYYEKYHEEIKQKQKLIKTEIKKQLSKQLKQFEEVLSEHDKMKKSIYCSTFDTMINEFKIRTSLLIEENINFLFKVINAEGDGINLGKVDKYSITKKLTGVNENGWGLKENNSNVITHNMNMNVDMSLQLNNANSFGQQVVNRELIFKKHQHQHQHHQQHHQHNKSSMFFTNAHKKGETLAQLNLNISCDSVLHNNNNNNTMSLEHINDKDNNNINKSSNNINITTSNNINNVNKLGFHFTKVFTPLNNSISFNNSFHTNKTDLTSSSTKTTSKDKDAKHPTTSSKPSPKKKSTFSSQNADLLETPKFFSNTQKKVSNLFSKSKVPKTVSPTPHLNKTFTTQMIPHNKQLNNSSFDNINNSTVISNSSMFKMNKFENENISIIAMSKQIEHLCKRHSFFPPVDTFNIFLNTAEIIHRRFFEESFHLYFPELFEVELDKDNLIKIESLYNMFMYLRTMRSFLFTKNNQMCMSSMLFVSDELIW